MKLVTIVVTLVYCGLCRNIGNRNRGYYSAVAADYGYNYPVPYPPFADEISTTALPPYSYVPPVLDLHKPNQTLPPVQADFAGNSYLPPDITLQPPQFDPSPVDDTVVIPLPPPANQYLPTSGQFEAVNRRLRVFNMSCLDDPVRGYFRASMTLTGGIFAPVVDDTAATDCVTVTPGGYRLDLQGERMKKCSVRYCANGVNMCVTIRVPSVKGLKLGDDALLTLRCRPQDRVVSHTKHFKFNPKNIVPRARSIPTVATGGSQRTFDTQVSLLRKSSTGRDFTVPVEPGSAVQLGEELLLRAAVKDGDGWRYSRLGEVVVHHVSSSGAAQQRPVTLIDAAGCRDARLRAVCPDNPVQSGPLVTTVPVRAFMFQGMTSTDEMLMSVRMIACLHYEDCHSMTRVCDDKITKTSRQRRNANATSKQTTDFQSYLEFRVVTPPTDASLTPQAIQLVTILMGGLLGAVVVAALVACRAGKRRDKNREQY